MLGIYLKQQCKTTMHEQGKAQNKRLFEQAQYDACRFAALTFTALVGSNASI
jgi:hypothetical protein